MKRRYSLLRRLFRKGHIDVLFFVDEKGSVRFRDVRKFCLDDGIVESRGTVTIILRNLTDMNLIQRKVVATRPVQTSYEMTEPGKQVVEHLKDIKKLLGS